MKSNKNATKVVYVEPVSYFSRKVRKEFKLGEFAESEGLRKLKGAILGHAVGYVC